MVSLLFSLMLLSMFRFVICMRHCVGNCWVSWSPFSDICSGERPYLNTLPMGAFDKSIFTSSGMLAPGEIFARKVPTFFFPKSSSIVFSRWCVKAYLPPLGLSCVLILIPRYFAGRRLWNSRGVLSFSVIR